MDAPPNQPNPSRDAGRTWRRLVRRVTRRRPRGPLMPLGVSIAAHALLLGVATTVLMFAVEPDRRELVVPNAQLAPMFAGELESGLGEPIPPTPLRLAETTDRARPAPDELLGEDQAELPLDLLARAEAGAELPADAIARAPAASFYGAGGNAYHVVYVVDRSGSMVDTLDQVRRELLQSVGRLAAEQDFHVIFFAESDPIELAPGRLAAAVDDRKRQIARDAMSIRARGRTEPIPALRRAFEVLDQADGRRPGRLIYLLTDGEFRDNAAVLAELDRLNAGRDVQINTILHQHAGAAARAVLETIARRHGGVFRFVR